MKDIQQLIKKNSQEGRYEDIFPKTFIDAVLDKESGVTLTDILAMFNMLFLSYNGSRSQTRLQVPSSLRREGLWITYVLYDKTVVTEWYSAEAIDDTTFGDSANWRDGSNALVGDISISSDGYWVINGEVTNIKAQGEAGITPILRVGSNNHLQVSYTNGSTYVDVSPNPVFTQFRVSNNKLEQSVDLGLTWTVASDYIAAWFRFTGTTGSSQADNVGKIQISRDNGATWSDLSGEFTNSLHIKGYVATVGTLPSTAVQGDIYGVGPTYDPSDTEHTNPIYQLYVKNSTGWVNNGRFTSISAGVVQEIGSSETSVMSQNAVCNVTGLNEYPLFSESKDYNIGDIVVKDGKLYEFTLPHTSGVWVGTDVKVASLKKDFDGKFNNLEQTFNVSNNFPTGGIDGSNKYNLETAISKISGKNIQEGFRLLFVDINTNITSSYTFHGGAVSDLNRWTPSYFQGENSIVMQSDFNKLDDIKEKGTYYISSGNLRYYSILNVYSGSSENIVIQELVGANTISKDGKILEKQNNVITKSVRIFNISSKAFLDRVKYNEWSKWGYYQNEFIKNELGNYNEFTLSQTFASNLLYSILSTGDKLYLDKSIMLSGTIGNNSGYIHSNPILIDNNKRISFRARIKGGKSLIWLNKDKVEIGSIEEDSNVSITREYVSLIPPENSRYFQIQTMSKEHEDFQEYEFYILIEDITNLVNEFLDYTDNSEYYVPYSILENGNFTDDSLLTYRKTPYIEVSSEDIISVGLRVTGNICGYFYNKDKSHKISIDSGVRVGESGNVIKNIRVPGWAKFVRFTTLTSKSINYEEYEYYIKINRYSYEIKSKIDKLSYNLKNTFEDISKSDWEQGTFNVQIPTTTYNRSPYIEIDGSVENIDLCVRIKGGIYLQFYGENPTEIVESYSDSGSSAATIAERINVPEGARYFRVVTMNSSHPDYEEYNFYLHKVYYKLEKQTISPNQNVPVSFAAIPSLQLWAAQEINFSDGSDPISKNFLFCEVDNTYNFYIARDKFGNGLSFLFSWRQDLQEATPVNYSAAVLPNGDILFIYKSEAVPSGVSTDSWQKNPILYEKANGYEPIEIDFGDSIKPGGWLQNVGFNAIYPYRCLIFGEYTRTTAKKARIWKVSYPYNDKNSWKIVKEFDVDYTTLIPNSIKHIHTIQFDQYTGFIYACTGDENQGSNIWVSKDQGESWELVYGPSEKYCRLLNFIFTDSFVYWATDSPTDSLHFLFKAERGEDGVIKVSEANELTQLLQPESGMLLATYGLSYLKTINALLLLERVDGNGWQWMPIRLWDLNSNSLKTIGRIESVSGETQNIGFRCQFLELYPSDNSIICGYNQFFSYRNYNKLLGNRDSINVNERINNILIRIDRAGDNFGVSFNSIYK